MIISDSDTEVRCSCGWMLKKDCPGEWEPGCDLGNNADFVKVPDFDISDEVDKALGINRKLGM